MTHRRAGYSGAVVLAMAFFQLGTTPAVGQAPGATVAAADGSSAVTTPWGDPDLQGIWTQEDQIPMQRPAQWAGKEFLTDEEIAVRDKKRGAMLRRDYRQAVGTYIDVAGAYNAVYQSVLPTGKRTALIVDPPDGRTPPVTPEAAKRRSEIRNFQLALLQNTPACQEPQAPHCRGGKYGPPSPKRNERMPYYNMAGVGFLNRHDHPEEQAMGWRCLTSALPVTGGYRQIVQSSESISISIDVGQGQSFQRVVNITNRPHLPSKVRQWWGDSRARWEGQTLVIDTTNFNDKVDFQGARENLHLIERYTRIDAKMLEYVVTLEDPTAWARPWTFKQELGKQDDRGNRFYPEPRCHEGKIIHSNDLTAARADEKAFAEGRGPDPATFDHATMGADNEENREAF